MSTIPTKFQKFALHVMHGLIDFSTDSFSAAFSDVAPNAATGDTFADITDIAATHGYVAGGLPITITGVTQAGGVTTVAANNVAITPVGGSIGPFRYIVRYRTNGTKYVADFLDLGVEVTIPAGIQFNVVWDPANVLFTGQ